MYMQCIHAYIYIYMYALYTHMTVAHCCKFSVCLGARKCLNPALKSQRRQYHRSTHLRSLARSPGVLEQTLIRSFSFKSERVVLQTVEPERYPSPSSSLRSLNHVEPIGSRLWTRKAPPVLCSVVALRRFDAVIVGVSGGEL